MGLKAEYWLGQCGWQEVGKRRWVCRTLDVVGGGSGGDAEEVWLSGIGIPEECLDPMTYAGSV